MTVKLTRIVLRGIRVTANTDWTFVELQASNGDVGTGEATVIGEGRALGRTAARRGPALVGFSLADIDDASVRDGLCAGAANAAESDIVEASFGSAIMQALADLGAQQANVNLAKYMGAARRQRIGVYANINRATRDRRPAGFADTAERAHKEGFSAFKIAPFDEVEPSQSVAEMRKRRAPGLERIRAVRDCIGPDCRLMVDCHWRFRPAAALELVDALGAFDLHWLECPVEESPAAIDDVVQIRRRANDRGVRLAGLEKKSGLDSFLPWLKAGAYDVMMPDIKHAGGPWALYEMAAVFSDYGVEFSPHNPTGPISLAASVQVCGALDASGLLEMQFRETPLFVELAEGSLPRIQGGEAGLPEGARGIGVRLNPIVAASLEETVYWSSDGS